MKIIHLNTFDIRGGAARAAYRIHIALQRAGIHSEMLVANKKSCDESVKIFNILFQGKKYSFIKKMLALLRVSNDTYRTCNLFPSGIHKEINRSNADVVHFHWIGNELISIAEVKKITKPIVWTLHDMWAFCGAEHYDINLSARYKQGYRENDKKKMNNILFDIDAWTWRRKKKYWKNINFHFVSPSKWLAECLAESSLFHKKKACIIHNCLDIDIFKPIEKKNAKSKINLPIEKKILLFGADGGDRNPLKGYFLLEKVLNFLLSGGDAAKIECVVFGGKRNDGYRNINGMIIREIGRINDDRQLAMLYSAADILVLPSIIDNFPNTIIEAMSCGTPCVAFDVGGISDIITHRKNGFLVVPFDTIQFAQGISWILADERRIVELGNRARKKVEATYNNNIVSKQYKEIYNSILEQQIINR